ncbi:anthranilate synthase component I [Brunnivagina elsteri]|uniref:Anthranilate synthase component 1 n=1 Tax=Brunnivagina elsteri CCALA 953 TaxID=987040 RepID=A0A2A2TM70_9CYAN|nr:anthranilate synthase component I [Calothrix elsteri]PAX59411.1 aminodeoxychorismate synthase component I [Calothrix elsteri CCALA 953]
MTSVWYWRSQPLNHRTGSDIFATLFNDPNSDIATLLESPYPIPHDNPQLARYSICAGKPRVINTELQMWIPPVGEILPFLQNLLRRQNEDKIQNKINLSSSPSHLPFIGGWLGWLGYDLAWEIEQLPRTKEDSLPFPVAFWYEPENFAVLDHLEQVLWLAATETTSLDGMELKLKEVQTNYLSPPSPISSQTPQFLSSQEDYETAVQQAKKYIQAGDIFQTNLSLRFTTQTTASGWQIYQALQKINPSPFACYYKTPWGEVVSCSPERLVEAQKCTNMIYQVSTRPIAGTRSRGNTPEKDAQLAEELLNNTKERAEHIMLVDLERNDLGRVCQWGTVKVDELLTIERYSHVMHLVSNVVGNLNPDYSTIDLIRAMFPGGTITGCPKVRCMEIIEELEPVRRSLFYGSCGYLDIRGNLDLNILIRTLLLAPIREVEEVGKANEDGRKNNSLISPINTVWGQVGAGIVADSDPEREWYESLNKAQAQLSALKQKCKDI